LSDHHLFVYGTLRRGCDNQFAQLLSERGQFIDAATVPGRLYDFGRYPGARPADHANDKPNEWICGEIFYLEEPGPVLAVLDEYEGPEFERAMVSTAGTIDCWIYWYIGDATGCLIPSGDWLQR
jgi:gamma-glutamylcyclotransferase (GGCT)/AIG2-like uncharacterized protein YtfP